MAPPPVTERGELPRGASGTSLDTEAHSVPAPATEAPRRQALETPARPRSGRFGPLLLAGLAVAGWIAFFDALSRRTRIGNSDNANAVLAGLDLVSGNVLLRGWMLPTDTFWSIDLPVYGVFAALLGPGSAVLHLVPVLIAALVCLVGFSFASEGRGKVYVVTAVGLMFVLLGLPHPTLASSFLQGPQHVGTTLFCLVAFRLMAFQAWRPRWWFGVAVLGAAVLGDPLALALGVAPVVAAGVIASWRLGRWKPLVSTLSGAGLCVTAALLADRAVHWLGGYTLAPELPLSPPDNWDDNVRAVPSLLAWLLGVGNGSGITGFYRAAHWFGFAAFGLGVAATILIGLKRRPNGFPASERSGVELGPRWLDDVLVMGVLGGVAAYVIIALPSVGIDAAGTRYVLAPLVYGVILAGRRAGDLARRLPVPAVGVAAAALLAVSGVYVATTVWVLRQPKPEDDAAEVVRWLDERQLSEGYGQYWSASIMTVKSRGKVKVRPVRAVDGRLSPNEYYASSEWFEAGTATNRFVVVSTKDRLDGVDEAAAVATFGPAAAITDVGQFRILVWDRDVGADLVPRPTPE